MLCANIILSITHWFTVMWFPLAHVLLWEYMNTCAFLTAIATYVHMVMCIVQLSVYCHFQNLALKRSVEASCSDAVLNKVRRMDQLLPWRAFDFMQVVLFCWIHTLPFQMG